MGLFFAARRVLNFCAVYIKLCLVHCQYLPIDGRFMRTSIFWENKNSFCWFFFLFFSLSVLRNERFFPFSVLSIRTERRSAVDWNCSASSVDDKKLFSWRWKCSYWMRGERRWKEGCESALMHGAWNNGMVNFPRSIHAMTEWKAWKVVCAFRSNDEMISCSQHTDGPRQQTNPLKEKWRKMTQTNFSHSHRNWVLSSMTIWLTLESLETKKMMMCEIRAGSRQSWEMRNVSCLSSLWFLSIFSALDERPLLIFWTAAAV